MDLHLHVELKTTAEQIHPRTQRTSEVAQESQIKALQETVEQLRKEVAQLSHINKEYDWHMLQ